VKTVFFGSGIYTIPIVEMLKKHGLVYSVTTEKEEKLIGYLKKNNIPFLSSNLKSQKSIQIIKEIKPDIGVLASYGALIPELIIENFKFGILNIHPSLLPKYKGPSPIQTTILNGDKTTGVTIIKLDDKIDHGPIAMQEKVELKGNETAGHLKNKLFAKGSQMMEKLLEKIERGEKIEFENQNHSEESFTSKVTRQNGFVNISNTPKSETLEKMIRAYFPWPGVWTQFKLYGKERRIKLLPEQKIQVEGKKVMKLSEFVNGYQKEGRLLLLQLGLSAF